MGIINVERGEQARAVYGYGMPAKAPYTHHNDMYPSVSWGFLLYAVRWHFNRMRQGELAYVLGTKQEYISRWELGKAKVPESVRTWIMAQLMMKLPETSSLPPLLPAGYPMPGRNVRQKLLMEQHGNFGGKGKPKKKAAKAA